MDHGALETASTRMRRAQQVAVNRVRRVVSERICAFTTIHLNTLGLVSPRLRLAEDGPVA